jgi:hypothetical protein
MRPDLTQPLPINTIAPTIAGNANAKVMVWRGLYDPVWMMENADNGAASTSTRNSYSYLLFSSAWSAVISALPFQVSLQISKMCTSMCHVTLLQGRLLVVGAGEFLPNSKPKQHSGNCVPICCLGFAWMAAAAAAAGHHATALSLRQDGVSQDDWRMVKWLRLTRCLNVDMQRR